MKPKLDVKPEGVAAALAVLGPGLTHEVIKRAVESGYLKRVNCTEFHPKTLPGTVHRAESIWSLRHDLVPKHGWAPDCASNQELIISPGGAVAIAVVSGDLNVGTEVEPTTKYDSGTLLRRAIAVNAGQGELFPETRPPVADGPAETRATWLLLSYVAGNEIRYELSLPVQYGEDNFINLWQNRIMFAPIEIDGIRLPELPPFARQPDVDVQLKA